MPTKIFECDYRNAIIIIPNGGNVKFEDKCTNRHGSIFVTNKEEEYSYLESCELFKRGIIRLIETREDVVEKDKDIKEYPDVKTLQEALIILKQECNNRNVEFRVNKSKSSILDCAKALKISFPNL